MTITSRDIELPAEDSTTLCAHMAWDDDMQGRRPCVLVAPDVYGLHPGSLYRDRVRELAAMGYVGFAMDVYGKQEKTNTTEQAMAVMGRFTADRPLLQGRLMLNLEAAQRQAEVQTERMAAIGYCFGGLCVLDLARINAPLLGVASFHGLLSAPDNTDGQRSAVKVLVLHGWDDPLVPPSQVVDLGTELSEAGTNWQLISYGHTKHAFTNPNANGMNSPDYAAYSPVVQRRSWQALESFLGELFDDD